MIIGRLGRVLRQQTNDHISFVHMSLLFCIKREGEITPRELARSEDVTPPSVTRSLALLEQLGLIKRNQVESDGRTVLISLTKKGLRECDRIRDSRDHWLADRLARLNARELASLLRAMPALEKLCDPELPENDMEEAKAALRNQKKRKANGTAEPQELKSWRLETGRSATA
jgi:DNA-binding MarR family transcriptional regulator